MNAHMPQTWITNKPQFTAFEIAFAAKKSVFGTMPGEPLLQLGWWFRNETIKMGWDTTFLVGYAQVKKHKNAFTVF